MNKYEDKKYLYDNYINKKLSTYQIGKLCNVTGETIQRWMKKFDIPCRSYSELRHSEGVNHCKLSQKAIDWINGELLGDGSIQLNSKYSASFWYSSKYLEYIEYVRDALNSFGIEQAGKIYKRHHKDYGNYSYHYASRAYVELLPIRKQWYPKGKKIIPRNIELTPSTVRQWHIGDGCLMHREYRRPFIILCTYGFLVSDVKWLVEQFKKLGFLTKRQPSTNVIRVTSYSTKKFLKYIGNCPVNCYKYKWAY